MFHNSPDAQTPDCSLATFRIISLITLLLYGGTTLQIYAQNNFNSGSTGADGAFAPATSQSIQVPESGVFNYTTVNIPAGVVITYTRNSQNTPVTILASGNVTIAGSLVVNGLPGATTGNGGLGGPGGFNGGLGGFGLPIYTGNPGGGPGGGGAGKKGTNYGQGGGGGGFLVAGSNGSSQAGSYGLGGPKYGANTLLPLIGGSGGGGGGAENTRGASGGGGGGAILIASSGTITFSGSGAINALGGNGGPAPSNFTGAGGAGSGGAIRLIANTLAGAATLNVNGGAGGTGCYFGGCGGAGGLGYVRIESYDYSTFTSTGNPANISYSLPNPVTLTTLPQLRIASVGGVAAPGAPAGSFQSVPDIIIPAAQANPVTVALEGANIPLGTVVQVTLTPTSGARTNVSSSPLAGTEAASTATASITLPAGMSVITAAAVCDLTLARAEPIFIDGERINKIEVAAVYGGVSQLTYITQSGRRIRKSD